MTKFPLNVRFNVAKSPATAAAPVGDHDAVALSREARCERRLRRDSGQAHGDSPEPPVRAPGPWGARPSTGEPASGMLRYPRTRSGWKWSTFRYDHEAPARETAREGISEEFVTKIRTGWWTTSPELLPGRERARGRY